MPKQFYNKGNKCFMLIDTERKGGIIKASKTPFDDYPIENLNDYLEPGENEGAENVEPVKTVDEKETAAGEGVDDSKNSGWDDFFN